METQEEYNQLKTKIMYKATRQLEFNPENYKGEIIDEISETIPGQASTVSEVLLKFSNGTLGDIGLPTHYDYEEEIEINDDVYNSFNPLLNPDFDLTDAEAYLRHQKAQKELESDLNKPKAKDKPILKQENQTEEEES